MPALEIMPQCGTMDEAQRRAHLPLPPRHFEEDEPTVRVVESATTCTSTSTSSTSSHRHHHHHHSTKIARWVRRLRRSWKHRNNHSSTTATSSSPTTDGTTAATGGTTTVITTTDDQHDHHSETEVMEESATSFSAIGVKYWGKILEDEEEEPPEAY
jgi:hypothetical protein